MAARVVQHRAPARHRRKYAETEKAERRFGEYCSRHADGGLDKDRLKNIGKQVAQHDPEIGSSQRADSQDEFKLLHFQDLGARQTSVAGPPCDNQRKDDLSDARAEESRKRDSQQDAGKRQKRVDQQEIYEPIRPTTKKTCGQSDRKTFQTAPRTTEIATKSEPRAPTGQSICVTSEGGPRPRLGSVASAYASNPKPRTEGRQARRSVRKR